ncbi:hypothetical protein TVAG_132200 [Trichomonas vaginalis G3]|uniref:Uncharacterized protein n=1 Tax=Trichomonas vaginalis (strain ATCC PRA-98 / G3) TaxID=412133 RepID=A2FNK3_TRIV3|nr:hypothetical protein TVAGG3_0735830 [Trichomonas vaginalis G3]EAX93503.1 hypothetical protein TVAG_132200 [Trichomonas vaginalis G3]KAI5511576.1 hypothetical protein TVAGG3_0735830 [Trichomonas vaginalis G3]|eukprot:XP_001306433.1 hypothetical protein [Trichomonas vaginalis G3]
MTTTTEPEDSKAVAIPPPLEDFVPIAPTIKFYNYQKLNATSKTIRKLQEDLMNFKQSEHVPEETPKFNKKETSAETLTEESENTQSEQIDTVSSDILETVPPFAPSFEEKINTDNEELKTILRNQTLDRFNAAEEFSKQESMLMSNYYDAQVRENMQRNEQVDKRPISDALRYVSKRISYPSEYTVQRFYKYNFRCEKITKKHKKSLTNLHNVHDQRSESLYQSQLQEIIAFSDFNKIKLPDYKIQKLPSSSPNE